MVINLVVKHENEKLCPLKYLFYKEHLTKETKPQNHYNNNQLSHIILPLVSIAM